MASTAAALRLLALRRIRPSAFAAIAVASSSQQQRRSFSQHFSSYEYPLKTEAPVITRTTAQEANETETSRPAISVHDKPPPLNADEDHFDDLHTLSPLEKEARRDMQKQHLSTKLTGSAAISQHVPSHIPPNIPSRLLKEPVTELTTLENGVRVVSQEMYSQVTTIGVLSNTGSRHERVIGTSHLLELLAFSSTSQYNTALEISHQLQQWGATSFASSGREQTLWCLDILRPNVEQGMSLLKEVVLASQMTPEEVENCRLVMKYQAMDVMPEVLLGEVLQEAAYGTTQQLGKPHYCTHYIDLI
jgi:processing peptidase subunit alpha